MIETKSGTQLLKIKEYETTLEDKAKIVKSQLIAIQVKDKAIKGLEIDLADMFQKLVQSDKQIRIEMSERNATEQLKLEDIYILKHQANINDQRLIMDTATSNKLRVTFVTNQRTYKSF